MQCGPNTVLRRRLAEVLLYLYHHFGRSFHGRADGQGRAASCSRNPLEPEFAVSRRESMISRHSLVQIFGAPPWGGIVREPGVGGRRLLCRSAGRRQALPTLTARFRFPSDPESLNPTFLFLTPIAEILAYLGGGAHVGASLIASAAEGTAGLFLFEVFWDSAFCTRAAPRSGCCLDCRRHLAEFNGYCHGFGNAMQDMADAFGDPRLNDLPVNRWPAIPIPHIHSEDSVSELESSERGGGGRSEDAGRHISRS